MDNVVEFESAEIIGHRAEFVVRFGREFTFKHVFLDITFDNEKGCRVLDGQFGADYMIENAGVWKSKSRVWAWDQIGETNSVDERDDESFLWRVGVPLKMLGLKPGAALRALCHGAQTGGKYEAYGSIEVLGPELPNHRS